MVLYAMDFMKIAPFLSVARQSKSQIFKGWNCFANNFESEEIQNDESNKGKICCHWKRGLNIRRRRIHSNHGKMALAKAYIWQVWNVLIMQKHLMDGQNG